MTKSAWSVLMTPADQNPVSHEGSVRMSISVPAELKRAMDATDEQVNWSRVAADAFRNRLKEIEAARVGPTIEDVVARLKATADLDTNEDYKKGFSLGVDWARETARAKQLQRLSDRINQFAGPAGPTAAAVAAWRDTKGSSIGTLLGEAIHGEPFEDWYYQKVFWDDILGEGGVLTDFDFVRGLIDGALSIWNAVADRLGMTSKRVESEPDSPPY